VRIGNLEPLQYPVRTNGSRDPFERRTRIWDRFTPPRRIWDLYSNRVIPYWALMGNRSSKEWGRLEITWVKTEEWVNLEDLDKLNGYNGGKKVEISPRELIFPVSHSWMPEEDRQYVDTPINGHQWPVPIPQGVTLGNVRIELLNLGAQYVWLDVLCLRQEDTLKRDSEKERIRLKEWKLDVPTIGGIYSYSYASIPAKGTRQAKIITYYSGLGRPFVIGDLSSPWHWINRAWTLQEIPMGKGSSDTPGGTLLGGKTSYPLDDSRDENAFFLQIQSIKEDCSFIGHLRSMRLRSFTNPIDKIAGLAFLIRVHYLPTYQLDTHLEFAWHSLIEQAGPSDLAILLFGYPAPGNGIRICIPSWDQILNGEAFLNSGIGLAESIPSDLAFKSGDSLRISGGYLEGCTLHGFAKSDHHGKRRDGDFRDSEGHTYKAFTPSWHQQPIPDGGGYVLIPDINYRYWIVGRKERGGDIIIRKVSILRTPVFQAGSGEERERLSGFRRKFSEPRTITFI